MLKSRSALNLVLVSDLYERVHYALVMASAAAATGRKVRLFLTMGALKALKRGGPERPGWHELSSVPGGLAPKDQDRAFAQAGIATFEELLQATAAGQQAASDAPTSGPGGGKSGGDDVIDADYSDVKH